MKKPLILLTNDDGVLAPGIRAIADALRDFAEVVVAAPIGSGARRRSISLDRPCGWMRSRRHVRDRRHAGGLRLPRAAAPGAAPPGAGGLGDQQRLQPRLGCLLLGDGRGRGRGRAARRPGAGGFARTTAAAGLLARRRVRARARARDHPARRRGAARRVAAQREHPRARCAAIGSPSSAGASTEIRSTSGRICAAVPITGSAGPRRTRPICRAPTAAPCATGSASVTPLGLDLTHTRLIGELVELAGG